MKARLALEHWTLVAENIDDNNTDFAKLVSGETRTVSAENAKKRIEKLLEESSGAKINASAFKSFSALAKYRNKIIHFSMPENAHTEIAELRCQAWYYLHELLETQWISVFRLIQPDFQTKLCRLNQLMHKQTQYLDVKAQELKPKIDRIKKEGWVFSVCKACKKEDFFRHSFTIEALDTPLGRCDRCNFETHWVHCPQCKKETYMYIKRDEVSKCYKCNHKFTIEEILKEISGEQNICDMEKCVEILVSIYGGNVVWCNECETETVVEASSNWFCTNCEEEFSDDDINECEYCNTQIAGGGDDDTYYSGCCMCDGKHGDIMAEDDQK